MACKMRGRDAVAGAARASVCVFVSPSLGANFSPSRSIMNCAVAAAAVVKLTSKQNARSSNSSDLFLP